MSNLVIAPGGITVLAVIAPRAIESGPLPPVVTRSSQEILVRVPLTLSLALTVVCAMPLAAQPASTVATTTTPPVKRGGITGLDVMTGTVFQEGQSSFSGVAMRMRVRNSRFVPSVEFLPTIEYWQNTSHLDAFDIETRRRDATLGLDLRWMFAAKTWRPYAGAGFSLHFLDDELRAPNFGTPRAASGVVKGGFDLLGGVDFSLGNKLGSLLELKLLNVTRYRQIKFNTGLAWNF